MRIHDATRPNTAAVRAAAQEHAEWRPADSVNATIEVGLTALQLQVLEGCAIGLSDLQIAKALETTAKSVQAALAGAQRRLGAASERNAVRLVLDAGLIARPSAPPRSAITNTVSAWHHVQLTMCARAARSADFARARALAIGALHRFCTAVHISVPADQLAALLRCAHAAKAGLSHQARAAAIEALRPPPTKGFWR